MFADGVGRTKDAVEGAKWLGKAAEQGVPDAQFTLGRMYATGAGVEKDSHRAAEWYSKAAEQGHAFAQHNLALMYASGEGVMRNEAEALKWEKKAAAQGDPYAQYSLGTLYAKGKGVSQDSEAAFHWIRKATEQGHPIYFEFEPGWKVGHYAEHNQYAVLEFIREGDDINNWKELLTIQTSSLGWGGSSPEDALNKLKAIREKTCPGATKWNIIGKNENSISYEWHAKPCVGLPHQHEIAKIIHGKDNTIIIHYVVKTYQMPDEQRARWVNRFKEAK
jgi:hypothetical protein